MPYYDVSIPLKLKNLTYFSDDENLIGFAVSVPLKNRLYDGVVISKRREKPENLENIRKIEKVWGKAYSEKFIEFLKWMSFYYLAEVGSILRLTFFDEILAYIKRKKKKSALSTKVERIDEYSLWEQLSVNDITLDKISNAVDEGTYKTFLLHSPSVSYEMKLMIELAKRVSYSKGPILFIFPEIRDVKFFGSLLCDFTDQEVAILHSEMKSSELYFNIIKILEQKVKIILGTRFTIFAPVNSVSLIIISQESNWLYKAEESPRYHVRECAVMRGFVEKCPVVLCDCVPTVTSYWNAIKGKFVLIDDFSRVCHPDIKILRQPLSYALHPDVLLNLKLNRENGVLLIAPMTGFSLLRCGECGEIIKCDRCKTSFIFHKSNREIECHKCSTKYKVPDICPYCGSTELHPTGTGLERLKEELENIFSKDRIKIINFDSIKQQNQGIFMIHAGKIKKSYTPQFKIAVFVNFDFFLSIPDYRATENALSKILSLVHLISIDGTIFIQTRAPEHEFFKFIQKYSFKDFYSYEIKNRREALLPPFSRLIKIIVKVKKTASDRVLQDLKDFLQSKIMADVIGPIKLMENNQFSFILRATEKRKLTEDLNSYIPELSKFKGIQYKIEVDPVRLEI